MFRYFPMSIEAINHIASTKFVNPNYDISQPKRQQHLCLPSLLMDMSAWEGKFLQVTKSSYTRCGSSSVVRQSLVVPTSDGSVLVEDLPPQTPIPRPPDLAPFAPLWPAAPPLPVAKKKPICQKVLGLKQGFGWKKHNFWGRCQELVRLTSFGLFCR